MELFSTKDLILKCQKYNMYKYTEVYTHANTQIDVSVPEPFIFSAPGV